MNDEANRMTSDPTTSSPTAAVPKGSFTEWWSSLFAAEPARPPDIVREIFETVVFVVVLVLLLKSFAAEAFVIPTGSMATTLLGYNKECKCPKCGLVQPVNCSEEVEKGSPVKRGVCQNCRFPFAMEDVGSPSCSTGDRVLVAKYFYDGPFSVKSETLREIAAILAILAAALLGGNAAGKLAGWFRRRSDHDAHPRRLLLPARIVGAIVCALVVGYCAFGTAPAMASTAPERFDVVVFKYPVAPQQGYTPMNYIKRLIGKPGETIAIKAGKLYVLPEGVLQPYTMEEEAELELHQDQVPLREKTLEEVKRDLPDLLWHRVHMHPNDPQAERLFDQGKFKIIRKPPEKTLAMMRLVYDNDHPASDLSDANFERWQATENAWTMAGRGFSGKGRGTATHWLRYQHLVPRLPATSGAPRTAVDKRLITDVLAYNSNDPVEPWNNTNWVSDLILELDATIEQPDGQFTLELSKAKNRFRARWELASGTCTLVQVDENQKEVELASAATTFKGKGTKRRLRFANVDDRLTVWVDSTMPFKNGVEIETSDLDIKPTRNDFEPASMGLSGEGSEVRVRSVKLFRDQYYTNFSYSRNNLPEKNWQLLSPSGVSFEEPSDKDGAFEGWQKAWQEALRLNTLYVQPGHYLCMGDNSSHSADSRSWGLVPERLMLGRALVVYWPIGRVGRIR